MNEGSLKGAGLPIGPLTGNDHRYVHAVPNGSLQNDYAIIRMQLGRLAVIEVERSILPRGLSSHLRTLWGTISTYVDVRQWIRGRENASSMLPPAHDHGTLNLQVRFANRAG